MSRLTDNDFRIGPLTFGKTRWRPIYFIFSSGDDDEDRGNTITVYAFGWVARLALPNIVTPYRIKHTAKYWDAATITRLGRDWYFESFPREYGFSINDGLLTFRFGEQTHDSSTDKSWSWFLPWTQWRFVRLSLYDLSGNHVWTEIEGKGKHSFHKQLSAQENCPKASFLIRDFDETEIIATTHIEEREWRFGEGLFSWLSYFRKAKIQRTLDIRFSAEVGPDKGSWKGGVVGHSIEMRPSELHESAMRRYCDQELRSRSGKYRITFVGSSNRSD